MFLQNRYTKIYYQIINRAKFENRKRSKKYNQYHHIIPKCIGGTNDKSNLVYLTYKEHRVCHCLLIKMQDNKIDEIKMRHSYGFFNKNSRFNGPRYKYGSDNIFSSPRIIKMVRSRMLNNNPSKDPKNRKRMSVCNPNPYLSNNHTKQNSHYQKGIQTRIKNRGGKIQTPFGTFETQKQFISEHGAEVLIKKIIKNHNHIPSSREIKCSKYLDIRDLGKSYKEMGWYVG